MECEAAGNRRYGVKDISYKGIHLGSTVADLLAALLWSTNVEDRTLNQKDNSHLRGVRYFDVVHPEPPLDHVFLASLDDHAYSITLEYANPGHYLGVGGAYGVVEALDSKYGQYDSSSGGEWDQLVTTYPVVHLLGGARPVRPHPVGKIKE